MSEDQLAQLLDKQAIADVVMTYARAIDRLDELPHQPGCGWDQGEPECDFGCEPGKLCEPAKVWKARGL